MFRTGNNLTWQIKEGQQKDGGGVSHEEIKNLEALLHLMTPGKMLSLWFEDLRAKGSLSLIQNVHF